MGMMTSQITSLMIVYSVLYSGEDQRKHESSVSLAFVRGIHQWPVNSPHKGPVTRKMFSFDDVIMTFWIMVVLFQYSFAVSCSVIWNKIDFTFNFNIKIFNFGKKIIYIPSILKPCHKISCQCSIAFIQDLIGWEIDNPIYQTSNWILSNK